MKRLLVSALALGTMSSFAVAGPVALTSAQLDDVTAGAKATVTYLGNSNNECTTNCDKPGRTTTTGPKGQIVNNDNPDCNNCTTTGPGNK